MFGVFPFGLVFLNFVGIVLFIITVFVAVKFFIRGSRGYRGFGGRPYWAHAGGHLGAHGRPGKRRHGKGRGRGGRGHGKRGGHSQRPRHARRDAALDLARARLAGGEINVDEFHQILNALEAAPAANQQSG